MFECLESIYSQSTTGKVEWLIDNLWNGIKKEIWGVLKEEDALKVYKILDEKFEETLNKLKGESSLGMHSQSLFSYELQFSDNINNLLFFMIHS